MYVNRNWLCNTWSVHLFQMSWSMSRPSNACAMRSSSGGRLGGSGASSSSPHRMCGGTSPWYSSWSSGISAPLSTCTRRSHSRLPLHARSVPLNGQSGRRFPHVARGYRQGVVRRNISPEACRDLVEARMLAERMERSFSEHCSQVLFRIPPAAAADVLGTLHLRCSCWDLDTMAASRGLGPARALSCPPCPISQLLVLAAGGPRGARRRPVQHPCPLPGASPSRLGARPFWRGHKAARGALPPPRLGGGRGLARRRRPLGPAPHGPRSGLDTPGQHNAMDPLLSHYLSIN